MMDFAAAKRRRQRLGRAGENAACDLLRTSGMTILGRNWRCRAGELDIIALDGTEIVFAEVKTMHLNPRFTPAWNLSQRQRRRNYFAAKCYLRALDITGLPGRFDLIEAVFFGPFLLRLSRQPGYLPPLPPRETAS